jgi:hypothetical protein
VKGVPQETAMKMDSRLYMSGMTNLDGGPITPLRACGRVETD